MAGSTGADARSAPRRSRGGATVAGGFTLIELLIVIGVLTALAATFAVVGMGYYRDQAKVGQAQLALHAIAAAIEEHGQRYWTINPGSTDPQRPMRNVWLWDVPLDPADPDTRDGIIDGAFYDASGDGATGSAGPWRRFAALEVAGSRPYAGYRGLAEDTQLKISGERIQTVPEAAVADPGDAVPVDGRIATGQVLDPWGHPYRILFFEKQDAARFGSPPVNPFGNSWFGVYSVGPDGRDDTRDDPTAALRADGTEVDDVRGWVE